MFKGTAIRKKKNLNYRRYLNLGSFERKICLVKTFEIKYRFKFSFCKHIRKYPEIPLYGIVQDRLWIYIYTKYYIHE